jgi:hypothetical protein
MSSQLKLADGNKLQYEAIPNDGEAYDKSEIFDRAGEKIYSATDPQLSPNFHLSDGNTNENENTGWD